MSVMSLNTLFPDEMDVPISRRDLTDAANVRWLLGNLGIRNSNHPDFKQTIQDLKSIFKMVHEKKEN